MTTEKTDNRELADERILGSGDFVQRILDEAEERQKHHFSVGTRRKNVGEIITKICEEEDVNQTELRSGSRRRAISLVRSRLAQMLVEVHGIPLAMVARVLGVSTSPVSKILTCH